MKIISALSTLCLSAGLLVGLGACQTTTYEKAQMEQRIQYLEQQLAAEKEVNNSVDAVAMCLATTNDPLFETYKTLHSINTSVANDVSALSYVQGSYGSDVRVYPLGGETASVSGVLLPKKEQYARHYPQIGMDNYSESLSEDVIVYPLEDSYSPMRERSVEAEPMLDQSNVQPVFTGMAGRRLTAVNPQMKLSKAQSYKADTRQTTRQTRSLTRWSDSSAVSQEPIIPTQNTTVGTANKAPRSLTGY
ncbi:MAG TPA: hypothetical protein DHW10_02210 [Rhodospirillaceae bacterium]|nr:hypothetical protein [Rhodospirillaceae bacterium]